MAELTYRNENSRIRRTEWGAIWAGLFTFIAIWSVFGLLGLAIFESAATPATGTAAAGMALGVGMAIWAVVLTIIAMYVAGRETGHLAAVTDRHDGLLHGMIVFGLSVGALLVVAVIGGSSITGGVRTEVGTHSRYLVESLANWGWTGFLALFLGWLAAMAGASTGTQRRVKPEQRVVQEIRPAA